MDLARVGPHSVRLRLEDYEDARMAQAFACLEKDGAAKLKAEWSSRRALAMVAMQQVRLVGTALL